MSTRALIVACEYAGTDQQFSGPNNNAHLFYDYLLNYGFSEDSVGMLSDDQEGDENQPTRDNIFSNIAWLVSDVQPGDSLVFMFSGNGSTIASEGDEELTGNSEVIICEDPDSDTSYITDAELHEALVASLPEACQLFCIFDSNNSGTILNMPYDLDDSFNEETAVGDDYVEEETPEAQVMVLSACKDGGEATYTTNDGSWEGLLMAGFLDTVGSSDSLTYMDLVRGVDAYIQGAGGVQVPKLSFGSQKSPQDVAYSLAAFEPTRYSL